MEINYYKKYKKYKYKYLKKKYTKQTNDIWIFNNFFEEQEFQNILDYIPRFTLAQDSRSKNRLSSCINIRNHIEFYDMIYKNEKLINIINSIKDSDLTLKEYPSYPIEYRKYFTGSKGMQWHIDTSLFTPEAFEVVLTLTNNSNSRFEWMDNGELKSISPRPNDLVIVRPKSILHQVTSIDTGERTILKFTIEFMRNNTDNKKIDYFNEINKCIFT